MLALILGIAVAVSLFAGDQEPSQVFRAEVYVVPVELSLGATLPFGIRKPYKDLALEDVTVVLDKKTYAPVKLTQDAKRPGHYLLSFTPAEEYRDGESHLIEVTVKMKSRRPVTMPMTITIPKPSVEANAAQP